jgi:hypothetical protein
MYLTNVAQQYCPSWLSRNRVLKSRSLAMDYSITLLLLGAVKDATEQEISRGYNHKSKFPP